MPASFFRRIHPWRWTLFFNSMKCKFKDNNFVLLIQKYKLCDNCFIFWGIWLTCTCTRHYNMPFRISFIAIQIPKILFNYFCTRLTVLMLFNFQFEKIEDWTFEDFNLSSRIMIKISFHTVWLGLTIYRMTLLGDISYYNLAVSKILCLARMTFQKIVILRKFKIEE